MDSKNKIPFVYDGTALTRMFTMQRELMSTLEKKGKFFSTNSDLTLNLSNPPDQAFFREISGFLFEELFEAEEKIAAIIDYAINQPNHNMVKTDAYQLEIGQEIADCTHFMIELMILAGVDEYVLEKQLLDYLEQDGSILQFKNTKKPLEVTFELAKYNNIFFGRKAMGNTYKDLNFGRDEKYYTIYEKICAKCSVGMAKELDKLMLQFLRDFHKALRMLKKKPWRKGTSLDIKQFQTYIGEAWGTYICWLELMGFESQVVFDTYYVKHQVVLERLNTNY